jgi:dTDP-4-dehydrorhamnose reductase
LGEEIIRTILTNYYIFRISWVFGPNGKNFVNTILRLSKEKESINVVSDQIGSPTYTMDVADYLAKNIPIDYGIHHLTNEGYISWYEFAKEILHFSNSKCFINPIKSEEYKTAAKRGLNSRISKDKITLLRNWKLALKYFKDMKK